MSTAMLTSLTVKNNSTERFNVSTGWIQTTSGIDCKTKDVTSALHCLSCNAVLSPVLCHRLQLCPSDEVCVTERYDTINGERLFNLGCYPTNLCGSNGKRKVRRSALNPDAGQVQCTECCKTDGCNTQGCGSGAIQRGPLCYNCRQSLDPQKCSVVQTCRKGEVCHLEKKSELGFTFYTSSCLLQHNCQDAAFGKRDGQTSSCCASDLCNGLINGTGATLPPLTTSDSSGGATNIGVIVVTSAPNIGLPAATPAATAPANLKAKDCKELLDNGVSTDGVYTIYPKDAAVKVYCDMTIDKGGWTVILDKDSVGTIMFNRTWDDYKAGFGNADGEYYVGNEIIRTLAKLGKSDVYFKLTDKGDQVVHASWKNFSIGPESDGYRLTFDRLTYSGDAGNTLNNTNPWYTHYNMEFTTSDKDADTYTSGNCADLTQGGWWFSGCYSVDLTAMTPANFVWLKDDGYYELKHAVMMIKRE